MTGSRMGFALGAKDRSHLMSFFPVVTVRSSHLSVSAVMSGRQQRTCRKFEGEKEMVRYFAKMSCCLLAQVELATRRLSGPQLFIQLGRRTTQAF